MRERPQGVLLLWLLGSRLPDTAAIALYASGPSSIGYALLLLDAGLLQWA